MKKRLMLSCALAAIAAGAIVPAAHADAVVDGTIYRIGGTAVGEFTDGFIRSTIDHIPFTVNADGLIIIDILSWEGEGIDVNGDGEIAFLDPLIYLFNDDGSLDSSDFLALSDDSSSTFGDGSTSVVDSYLAFYLPAGNYILTVGGYNYDMNQALAGQNLAEWGTGYFPATLTEFGQFVVSDHGDYRVTFTGDVTVTPAPGALALMGMGGLAAFRRRR